MPERCPNVRGAVFFFFQKNTNSFQDEDVEKMLVEGLVQRKEVRGQEVTRSVMRLKSS